MSRFIRLMPPMAIVLALLVLASVFLMTGPAQAGWAGSEFRLTVDVSPGEGGDVRIDSEIPESYPDISTHESGAVLELAAVPARGYVFVEWSGDLSGTDESASLELSCDKAVTAIFSKAPLTFAWWWLATGIGVLIIVPLIYLRFAGKPTVLEK